MDTVLAYISLVISIAIELFPIILLVKIYTRQKKIDEKIDFISNRIIEIKSLSQDIKHQSNH